MTYTDNQRISEIITLAKYYRCLFCATEYDKDKNFCCQECEEHYINYGNNLKMKGGKIK